MNGVDGLWPWLDGLARAIATWLVLDAVLAAVLFGVVVLLVVVLRPSSALVRSALWLLVLLRLVLPPGLTHPASCGAVLGRLLPGAGISSALELPEIAGADSGRLEGRGSERFGEAAADAARTTGTVTVAAVAAWQIGLMLILLLGRRSRAVVQHAVRTSCPAHEPWQLELVRQWCRRLGIRRRVELRITAERLVPFTTGVLRPRVVLPRDLVVHGRRIAVESVIAHELAHVARLDSLWGRLQQLLQAVYFFHPLVWISNARLCHEREQLCDARVLEQGRLDPREYARSLLEVLQLDLHRVNAPAFGPRHRRLAMRLRSILDHRPAAGLRTPLAVAAVTLLGLFLLPMMIPGAAAGPSREAAPAAAASVAPAPPMVPPGPILVNPLPGSRVTQPWGRFRNPFSGKLTHHDGIDLAAPAGTEVRAAGAGTVAVATETYTESGVWGHVVVLDHGDGVATLYAHLGELLVSAGDTIEQGQPIARVGSTGRSTGPHVHLEIRRGDQPEDPATFVAEWSGLRHAGASS